MANYQIFLGIHQEGSEDWNGKKYMTQSSHVNLPQNILVGRNFCFQKFDSFSLIDLLVISCKIFHKTIDDNTIYTINTDEDKLC